MIDTDSLSTRVETLILECAALEPLILANSAQIMELERILSTIEPDLCDEIAKIFFETCTSFNGLERNVEPFQRVIILSLVEKMNFPEPTGSEGFHHWADECATQLMDLGCYFFDPTEPEELELALSLLQMNKISDFAQTYMMQSMTELTNNEMKKLLGSNDWHLVWLGAFANTEFANRENIEWLVEHFPNSEFRDLAVLIEQGRVFYSHWEYPFLYFSREQCVTDEVIVYLIEILANDYEYRNTNEMRLAESFLSWEHDFEIFIRRALELGKGNQDVLSKAQNSKLSSLAEALI